MSSAIDTMYPWITEAGGSYLNDDGTCGWNSDETVTALDVYKRQLYMTVIIAFKKPSEMTNDVAGALAVSYTHLVFRKSIPVTSPIVGRIYVKMKLKI